MVRPEDDPSILQVSTSQERLNNLVCKARKIGDYESIVTLKYILAELRGTSFGNSQSGVPLSNDPGTDHVPTLSRKLQNLKKGIELHKNGPMRRFYLATLADEYFKAQADAEKKANYLTAVSGPQPRRRNVIREATGRPGKRLASGVLAQFLDHLFPGTVGLTSGATSEPERKLRMKLVKKFDGWKKVGKKWTMLMLRFGAGTLLILPNDLSDEE